MENVMLPEKIPLEWCSCMQFDLDLILTQSYTRNLVKNESKSKCITPKESSLIILELHFFLQPAPAFHNVQQETHPGI